MQVITLPDVIAGQVLYGEDQAIESLQAEILATNKAVPDTFANFASNEQDKNDLFTYLMGEVMGPALIAASFIKNEKFAIEHEWRLVTYRGDTPHSRDELKFRHSGDLLVPCIPVKLCYPNSDVLPLSLIRLGPTVPARALQSVQDLLTQTVTHDVYKRKVEVLPSEVPLQQL